MSKNTLAAQPYAANEPAKPGRPSRAREEIMGSAIKFLGEHPFRDMTVNSLMSQTTLSRASFYNHFSDIQDLMGALLDVLEAEIMKGVYPWLSSPGDPVALLHISLTAEVDICCQWGPLLKAVNDSAGSSTSMEKAWYSFLDSFDRATSSRIAADQKMGLIDKFDPKPVAATLNHSNAGLYVRSFGLRPHRNKNAVLKTVSRVWISTLYGKQWVENSKSTLYRK